MLSYSEGKKLLSVVVTNVDISPTGKKVTLSVAENYQVKGDNGYEDRARYHTVALFEGAAAYAKKAVCVGTVINLIDLGEQVETWLDKETGEPKGKLVNTANNKGGGRLMVVGGKTPSQDGATEGQSRARSRRNSTRTPAANRAVTPNPVMGGDNWGGQASEGWE